MYWNCINSSRMIFGGKGGGGDKGKMFLNGKLCANRFFLYRKIKRIFSQQSFFWNILFIRYIDWVYIGMNKIKITKIIKLLYTIFVRCATYDRSQTDMIHLRRIVGSNSGRSIFNFSWKMRFRVFFSFL